MRIWLAYQFRGANFEDLRDRVEEIQRDFSTLGHHIVTMIADIQHWEPAAMSKTEAVFRAYQLMHSCDLCLGVYTSLEPSEGRGFDIGYFAGCGKPTIMAISAEMKNPFTEALFVQNPANARQTIPSIIRYHKLADIAKHFSSVK